MPPKSATTPNAAFIGAAAPGTTDDVPVAAGESPVEEAVGLGVTVEFSGIKTLKLSNRQHPDQQERKKELQFTDQ